MATSNGNPLRRKKLTQTEQPLQAEGGQDYYTALLQLADETDENGTPQEPRFAVEELMGHLINRTETLSVRDLFAFSDLSRQDAEFVRQEWELIPAPQRRQLLQSLVSIAEEDVDWHLGRFLRMVLGDTDAVVRRLAIEGLWEEVSPDLIGPLVQILHNDDEALVRAAAAATLGSYVLAGELDELDSAFAMRTEEALLAVLQNPDEALLVQCRALESIAYSGETGIRQLIEDAYYSPEEELRISALVAMGRSADTRWRGLVRAELQNPSPQMRVEAARACGELEVQKAEPELIELLADEEQLVRLSAIFALGRLGGRRAQDALRIIANGDDGIDAEAADLALEEVLFYGDSEVTPLLDDSDEEDAWDFDSWDTLDDLNDDEFGLYEDN